VGGVAVCPHGQAPSPRLGGVVGRVAVRPHGQAPSPRLGGVAGRVAVWPHAPSPRRELRAFRTGDRTSLRTTTLLPAKRLPKSPPVLLNGTKWLSAVT
jgi:hypothetical protein